MLLITDLRTLARERLVDAEALLRAKRYDGGIYLCGYAVEHALKARICAFNVEHSKTSARDSSVFDFDVHDAVIITSQSPSASLQAAQ